MTNDIFSDHPAMRAALGESAETIDAIMREVSEGGDATGLDSDTFDKLSERTSMTAGELEKAIQDALIGRQAVDEFEDIDQQSARSVDEGGRQFTATGGSPALGGGNGLSPYGTSGGDGVQTNLSSGVGDPAFQAKQENMQAAAQAQQAQSDNAQMQAQMQQARDSSAWQRAMADQQNQAMLNQMNIAAQQQAMVQAAEMQDRLAEQAAAQQAAVAEGGAAPPSGGDVELSSEEIQTIIRDLFEEEGSLVDGGSGEFSSEDYGGSYEPAGLSGLSVDEVSFEKMADPEMSDEQVAEIVNAACDLNGISDDPAVRDRFINLWSAMSLHESGHNANAANGWDSNAVGSTQEDGFPAQSSRGPWQCIPSTFAANHIEGTSTSIYDPLASAAASINYTMERYGIDENGNGLDEFASVRGIDVNTGESHGGYIGY